MMKKLISLIAGLMLVFGLPAVMAEEVIVYPEATAMPEATEAPVQQTYSGTWELKSVKNYDKTRSKSFTVHYEVNGVRLNQKDTYTYKLGDTLEFKGLLKGSNTKQGNQKKSMTPTAEQWRKGFSMEFAVAAGKKSGSGSASFKFTFTWKPAQAEAMADEDEVVGGMTAEGSFVPAQPRATVESGDNVVSKEIGLEKTYSGYWTVSMSLSSTHHSGCKGHYSRSYSVDGTRSLGEKNVKTYKSGTEVKLYGRIADGQGHHPAASKTVKVTPTDSEWREGFSKSFNVTMGGGHGGKVVYRAVFKWHPVTAEEQAN